MEIETWLHRMESRAERMGTIAITADILDAQQKEQKVSFCLLHLPENVQTSPNANNTVSSLAVVPRRAAPVQTPHRVVPQFDPEIDCRVSVG